MSLISKVIPLRRTRHARRQASAVLRFCVALWLLLTIAYTPIHLCLEPHSDEADSGLAAASTLTKATLVKDGHEGEEHHEQHSAAQHQLKVLRSSRSALAEVMLVPVMEWMDAEKDYPQPQVFGFSGLSPPELTCCWQFLFRAALPVRAPSLFS